MTLHAVINILTGLVESNLLRFVFDYVGSQVLLILVKAYQQKKEYIISRGTNIMRLAQK